MARGLAQHVEARRHGDAGARELSRRRRCTRSCARCSRPTASSR